MNRRAAVVAVGTVVAALAGCAAQGDGLVIRFEDPTAAAGGATVAQLELFVGRAGDDGRLSRDYDPARDLFAVDATALDGYRLYLRADVVPTDLEAVAIVGYDGDPDAGAVPVIFGLVEHPPFAAGELTEIGMTFEPAAMRGQAVAGARWIERWGAAPIEPVADHACLSWGTAPSATPAGQIVRIDDRDCDGTVPPTCDPMQLDRTLLEGAADVDGDGFSEWGDPSCAACLVQDADDQPLRPVRCDCDETDPTVNFGEPERCDGKDTNCDGRIDGDYVGPRAVPCQIANGVAADCTMGVATCTESTGTLIEGGCSALPMNHVSCVDLSGCATPNRCPIGGAMQPATLTAFHCTQRVFGPGPEYCGTAPIAAFFPAIGTPLPTRCTATVWNGESTGWKVVLTDGTGQHDRQFIDAPCDELGLLVEQAPTSSAAHTFAILVLGDAAGTPFAALPIDLGLLVTDAACDALDVTTCVPPGS